MDLVTHIVVTRKFVSKDNLALIGAVAPDIPFYLFYPTQVAIQGKFKEGFNTGQWPPPPSYVEVLHHSFHSLPIIVILGATNWLFFRKRFSKNIWTAWVVHVLVDIPTHSRQNWAPKFLWPFSNICVDGISWVEVGISLLKKLSKK